MSRFAPNALAFAAGRAVWRTLLPLRLRQAAQPLAVRAMELRVGNALRVGPETHQPGPLIVSGLLSGAKGVSEGARLSLLAFQKAGLTPISHDLAPVFNARGAGVAKLPATQPGGVWFLHVNAPEAIQALGRHNPAEWRGRYRIAYWAYELARVPANWARIADAFDEVWAPSAFVADALRAAGVRSIIRTMPHPVALGDHASAQIPQDLNPDPGVFTALALADLKSSAMRKNIEGAVEIFKRGFPVPGASRLLIKIRENDAFPKFRTLLAEQTRGRPDMMLLTQDLDREALHALIASVSVLLSPHRAEGFGLPLAEAMFAGVPVLATGWSGNMEYMSDFPNLLLPFRPVKVRDPYGVYRQGDLEWAEPDVEEGAARLRALAAAPPSQQERARMRAAVERLSDPWRRDNLLQLPIGQLSARS